jgi:putative ABC transport system permease protein
LNFCLVAIQVSLSLLLLFGAGLFVRTLRNLESLGPGFPTDHLLTFTIDPSLNGYSDEEIKSFYERLNVNLQTMPGVTSVGFSSMPLLKAYAWQNAVLGKDFEGAPIEEQPVLSEVGPDYFATLGIPIVAGRANTRMRQFDPHVPVVGLETMNEQIGFSLRTERLVASLSAIFGGLATLIAVIGLYGVM